MRKTRPVPHCCPNCGYDIEAGRKNSQYMSFSSSVAEPSATAPSGSSGRSAPSRPRSPSRTPSPSRGSGSAPSRHHYRRPSEDKTGQRGRGSSRAEPRRSSRPPLSHSSDPLPEPRRSSKPPISRSSNRLPEPRRSSKPPISRSINLVTDPSARHPPCTPSRRRSRHETDQQGRGGSKAGPRRVPMPGAFETPSSSGKRG